MASTQKSAPRLTEALGGEKSPTGTLDSGADNISGIAGSYETPRACLDRRSYFGINPEAASDMAQSQSHLYAAEVGTSYSNQPGNNVAISNWNYGGYYRPSSMCFAEYGDTYPSDARPLRNAADLPSCAARSSKLRHREQRSSCSFDPRFTASKRHVSETDANSFVNAHALIQPYFPVDELRHQPASYPRLSCEQNLSLLDFACRFPSPIQSPHSALPHANLMQPELGGVPLTTHSDQYPVAAQPFFQQQFSPLISGDVSAQSCSYSDNVANLFPQPSLNQLIRELQANPPPAYEGLQASNRRFSSNGFFESNDSNLRRLSDICSTSSPFNHLGTVPEHDTIFGNFRECSENDVYTRVTLGPAMNSEGSLSYGIKSPPRSACMFRRRADIFRSHASGSSEKLDFEKILELPQTGSDKPLATITEIDVVGEDEYKKDPTRQTSCPELLPKRWKRGGPRECECTVCGKILARASTLKIHMRQHTGDRPFKCVTCAKTFAQAGLLQSHSRTHTGERPFTCSFCQKTFSHSSALKTHLRTHTGERPHKCQVVGCDMAFGDSSTLSKHARTHTGERPYCCDVCGKRFTQSGNLHKHKKSVHNIKNSSSWRKRPDLQKDMSVKIESESSTSQSDNSLHALLSN